MEWNLSERAPEPCAPSELRHPGGRALAEQLARGALPFARFLECRRGPEHDIVLFDAEVELAQRPQHDIRPRETIAVEFALNDPAHYKGPDVLALRADFPSTVPHLNIKSWEWPRSLCVYEFPFRDVLAQWTPARFVARIRDWLRDTARGELHGEDQPLEPLLPLTPWAIILPDALRADPAAFAGLIGDTTSGAGAATFLPLTFSAHGGRRVLITSVAEPHGATGKPADAIAAVVRTGPRHLVAMRRIPESLSALHSMLATEGDDLVGTLRVGLARWDLSRVPQARFILVVFVPKRRTPNGLVEETETWVMLAGLRVNEVGEAIGIWELRDGVRGALIQPDRTRTGADVSLELASPYFTLSRAEAAKQNGRTRPDDRPVVAIGLGSLGSQVIINASRAAIGRWTIIDDDILLPHNMARHGLPGMLVGHPKALGVELLANHLTDEGSVVQSIVADVLAPGVHTAAVSAAFHAAHAILDMSASVTVARMLARDAEATGRRISLFLNPRGTDLTLLAEDVNRANPLDLLEMQYYRALLHSDELRDALKTAPTRIRYGRSCRDVSVELPQALVSLHAGIGLRALEQALADGEARIRTWCANADTFGVQRVDIQVSPLRQATVEGWTLISDVWLLELIAALRAGKLPNETGGVLVGTFDLARRLVYIVDTIPSPPDSQEWPTHYIRGCAGLNAGVREIRTVTGEQLDYVGEWHSHPARSSCSPSWADVQVFAWLKEWMDQDGLPAVMLIAGDDGLAVPYVDGIAQNGAYPAELRP